MNVSDALDRLEMYTAPDEDPTLNPLELQILLDSHAVTDDADGNAPTDTGWTPTYSVTGVYRAAAEAWKVKAGRVAGRYDFTTDGQTFRRGQQLDHCERMVKKYARLTNTSVKTDGYTW